MPLTRTGAGLLANRVAEGKQDTYSELATMYALVPIAIETTGVYGDDHRVFITVCCMLVSIVGGACFLRHQLAAVFNASFGVYRMTYEISRINRMGEEGDFCDVLPTYP